MSADLDSEKAAVRRDARALRAGISAPGAGLALIEHFPLELVRLGPVAGYWPFGGEIDPRPLMAAIAKAGQAVALPRMEARDGPARFLLWEDAGALKPDAYGMLAPPSHAREVAPKVVLTPLLAFDRAGRRLGQGGGHYDRTLARLKPHGVVAVGIAYAAQEMSEVPEGPLDQRLDWVVTETEAIRCGAAEGLRGR